MKQNTLTLRIRSETTPELFEYIQSRLRRHFGVLGITAGEDQKTIIISTNPNTRLTPEICRQVINSAQRRTLTYHVPDATCIANCFNDIEKQLKDKIETKLKTDLITHLTSFVPKNDVTNAEITTIIEEAGFTPTLVNEVFSNEIKVDYITSENEEKYQVVITGMRSEKDVDTIHDCIVKNLPFVNRHDVDYSTQILTLYAQLDSKKSDNELTPQENLWLLITRKIQLPEQFKFREVVAPANHGSAAKEKKEKYFKNTGINMVVGALMLLFWNYIPSPLTLMGKSIGLMLGGTLLGVMWVTGYDFYKGALLKFIRRQSADMNTLIALGTGTAWVYSMILCLAPTLFPVAMVLHYQFLAVNMILGIVNFGKGVRQVAEKYAHNQVKELGKSYLSLQSQMVLRKERKNKTEKAVEFREIPFTDIQKSNVLFIKKGQRFPVECTIIESCLASIEQEVVTGEDRATKKRHDIVHAGSLLVDVTYDNKKKSSSSSPSIEGILVQANCNGKENTIYKIFEEVCGEKPIDTSSMDFNATRTEQTTKPIPQSTSLASKNKSNSKANKDIRYNADTIARLFVPVIIGIALFSALCWGLLGPEPKLAYMVRALSSVFLCACPCAFALAGPLATTIGVYKLASKDILVRNSQALEKILDVDTYVFDKTGTLTTTKISSFLFNEEYQEEAAQKKIWSYISSLESKFDHPIANSLLHMNQDANDIEDIEYLDFESCEEKLGGVTGKLKDQDTQIQMGDLRLMESTKIEVPELFKAELAKHRKEGKTSIFIALNKQCIGILGMKHALRPDAQKAIDALIHEGKDVHIYSGDSQETVDSIAKQLAITPGMQKFSALGGLSSQDKKDKLNLLKAEGRTVAMIGDGVNDFPALGDSDVGIAMGVTSLASSCADITMQNFNFRVLHVVAQETVNTINENLRWTLTYNAASIFAASGLLYPLYGILYNPIFASVSMAISSIFVVFNSSCLLPKIENALQKFKDPHYKGNGASSTHQQSNVYLKTIMAILMPYLAEIFPSLAVEDKKFKTEPPSSTLLNQLKTTLSANENVVNAYHYVTQSNPFLKSSPRSTPSTPKMQRSQSEQTDSPDNGQGVGSQKIPDLSLTMPVITRTTLS